jgi:hypothetical protein
LRRRHDDVGGAIELRGVLREGHERDDILQPELGDETLRLRVVVARQVRELERTSNGGPEELLASDRAADDQVPGIDPARTEAGCCLDELAEPL